MVNVTDSSRNTDKKRTCWGASCKYSRGNTQLSSSPIPLAPHLARDWVTWNDSDDSEEGGGEGETIQSLDRYHRKIFLGKRIPKTGLLPRKSGSYCSSLSIRSLSVSSRNPNSPVSQDECDEEVFEDEASSNCGTGFKTVFRTKKTSNPVQYQWVPSHPPKQASRSRSRSDTEEHNAHPSLAVNVGGSSTNLSAHRRPNTAPPAPSARCNIPVAALSKPPHATCRPRTSQQRQIGGAIRANPAHHIDFHKLNAQYRTGRAGLKDFSAPAKHSAGGTDNQREDLSNCVKMERMVAVSRTRCSSSSGRIGMPEPPAPSPLVPH